MARSPSAKIRAEVLEPSGDWEPMAHNTTPEGVMPIGFLLPEHQPYVGRRLAEIAAMRGQHWVDAALDLLLAEGQRISTIYFSMDEANVRAQLALPWVTISTDAGGHDPAWAAAEGPVHPRSYGTYPRVLGEFVQALDCSVEVVGGLGGDVVEQPLDEQRQACRPGAAVSPVDAEVGILRRGVEGAVGGAHPHGFAPAEDQRSQRGGGG